MKGQHIAGLDEREMLVVDRRVVTAGAALAHVDLALVLVRDVSPDLGISPANLDRIFDEFHQVDGSASREFGGVGLGLSLVRRLLGELSGTIAVTSELGRGSTFTVTLPSIATPPA